MIGIREALTLRPARRAVVPRRGDALRRSRRLLIAGLFGLDILTLALAMTLAALLRVRLDGVLSVTNLATERHLVVSVLLIPVLLVLFAYQGMYAFDHILVGTREYAGLGRAVTYGAFVALAASYAAGEPLVSRSWLPLVWILSIGCVGIGRFAARRLVRRMRARGVLRTRVVIVGASGLGVAIAEQLLAAKGEGLDIIGFLDEYLPLGQPLISDIGVIGRPADLLRSSVVWAADEYILVPQALPHERQEEISRLMVARQGPVVRIAISSSDLLTHGVQLVERGSVPLVRLGRARLHGVESVLKNALDRGVALLALVLLAPFAVAAMLRAHLAGIHPILNRQTIYGSGGERRSFWLFGPDVATWPPLRGLPALLGVLSGNLSLVGPRPILCHTSPADATPLWLTAVNPGLTGPWRLSGPEASLDQQALLDLTYVRNYTIWEDLRILVESLRRLSHGSLPGLIGRWEPVVSRPESEDTAPIAGIHTPELLVRSQSQQLS